MTFKLIYHPRAVKRLTTFPRNDKKQVMEKLALLKDNPQNSNLDIRKMVNTKSSYRIRIGKIRAIYQIDFDKNIIYMYDIDYRGNIY